MSIETLAVECLAASKNGMTLGELAETIDEALSSGMPNYSTVKARVGFFGQVKSLSIERSAEEC